jgi:hypothetical protein
VIISFFVYQNKKDLSIAYDYYDKLSYDYQVEHCKDQNGYNFPCFLDDFESYLENVSLTGVSIGLKLSFNYLDDEKESVSLFRSEKVKDIHYTVNYLKLNNLAIRYCCDHFYGFDYLYSGYLSSLRRFLDKGESFSMNLIEGLRSDEGIKELSDASERQKYYAQINAIEGELKQLVDERRAVNEEKIRKLLDKAAQAKK